MKKVISQITLILMFMMIGFSSCLINKAEAASFTISAPNQVKVGEKFNISLNLPETAVMTQAKIVLVDSEGNNSYSTYLFNRMNPANDPNRNITPLVAKAPGRAKIIVYEVTASLASDKHLFTDEKAQIYIDVVSDKPEPKPEPKPEHKHEYEWKTLKKATCTEPGERVQICKSCKAEGKKETIKALGHDWDANNKCKRCGAKKDQPTKPNEDNKKPEESKDGFTSVNEMVVVTDKVNVREKPNTNSKILQKLEKGTKVKRTGTNKDGWSRIEINGKTAYVSSNFLKKVDDKDDKENKDVKFKDVNEQVIAKKSCNLRASWSADSDRAGFLNEGDELTRTGIGDNGWSRVKYNGKDVYVLSSLIQKADEPEEVVAEDVTPEKTEIEMLQEKVGVIPEVGNNIAVTIYLAVTIMTVIAIGGYTIYTKNK